MGKPWDKLRRPVKSPIGSGGFSLKARVCDCAYITVDEVRESWVVLDCDSGVFDGTSLRQLAEFCVELADQLEGK